MRSIQRAINKSSRLAYLAISSVLMLAAVGARAGYVDDSGLTATAGEAGLPTSNIDPSSVIGRFIGYILSFMGFLFLGLVIYGGFVWMTAQGNEEKIKKAKNVITSAVIGLVVVFASYAIANAVIEALTAATEVAPTPTE